MTVECAKELDNWPMVFTRAITPEPFGRPELRGELHPSFGTLEVRLDVGLFRVSLFDVVARLASDEVRCARRLLSLAIYLFFESTLQG